MRSRFVSFSLARRIISWVYDTKYTPLYFLNASAFTGRFSIEWHILLYNIRHRSIGIDRCNVISQREKFVRVSRRSYCHEVLLSRWSDLSSIDWWTKEKSYAGNCSLRRTIDGHSSDGVKTLLKYGRCILMAVVMGNFYFSPHRNNMYIFTVQHTTILYLECTKIITR